jgi:MFS family permease
MSIPSWNSLLGDYTDEYNRGKIIGRINSVSQLGSFFAMIVAFILNINQKGDTTPSSFTIVLAVAAATSFLSGLLVHFIDEKPPTGRKRELNLGLLVQDKRLSRYLLLNFVYGMGMSFAWPLFPMVITHRLSMKIWQISTLSIVSSLLSSLAQPHLGALMDNVGRRPIIVSSRVLMSVAPLTYALASEWWHIAIGELFLGFGMAAWMSSESTYIIDLAPGDLRATYLASSTAAFGIASFIGSNVGGQIIETYFNGLEGLNQGLFLSAFLRLSFGLAYFTAFESKKDNRES